VVGSERVLVEVSRSTFTMLNTDSSAWSHFVAGHPDASIFHHPSWSRVLARSYGYDSCAAVVRRGDAITAGLPLMKINSPITGRRWVALPFSDHCRLLAVDDASKGRLVKGLVETQTGGRSPRIEIRDFIDHSAVMGTRAYLHELELEPDSNSVFGRFKKTRVQQSIQQAEREGVIVHRNSSMAYLRIFLTLHGLTRHRHGVPVQPRRYFRVLWEELLRHRRGFVSVAWVGRRPIASSVFLCWNQTLTYKYSASDPAYWSCRPNHAILWDAIRWGCEQGYRSFDFGRSDAENTGLRAFKGGWGATESPLVYETIGGKTEDYGHGLTDRLMGIVLRKSPAILGRAAGELLYRHVG